ncbi:MAG: hypothetical protein GEV05_08675 [Betaproteobacteria bacterium]|nr:hypothetical protein [Betaproteobacteria bacterium]
MKRWIVRSFALVVLALPAAVLALAWLTLDDRPLVVRNVQLTQEQVARAQALAKAHDPRTARAGALRTITLSAEDVDIAANYLVAPYGGGAKVALQPGAVAFWATARAPANPFGAYLNVEGVLRETSALPQFDNLRIGRVPVPAMLADRLLAHALGRLGALDTAASPRIADMPLPQAGEGSAAADFLHSVHIEGGQVQIVYRWRDEMPERFRRALFAVDDARLRSYQQRLAEFTAGKRLPRQISLRMLLEPMLGLAAERSASSDPVAENRAALLVTAFYVNGRGLSAIVPQARDWPRPRLHKVTLGGRHDLAQHFTVSAALAAAAGSPLANAIGVYKEIEDARGGSGFSFPDLAADRAGTVFGAQAARSPQSARSIQQRFLAGAVEADFMPDVAGLPVASNEADFKRRFGGVGEAAYRRVEGEVERRIKALALYR